MPFVIPDLPTVRGLNRDYITAQLNAGAIVPNSVLRVLADSNSGLCYLTLLYIEWLSAQFLPDKAESEWLDRHANIWLPGGRKQATFASGVVQFPGDEGTIIPAGTQLTATGSGGVNIILETTESATIDATLLATANVQAIVAGTAGNLPIGTGLNVSIAISGLNGSATVINNDLSGGTDIEGDTALRARIILRIQNPPMGGDANDYVQWALSVPGVTRAWASPLEMGMGTVTVRFMMDELRATTNAMTNGFPNSSDIASVQSYLNSVRPVAVKDFFVEAPIPEPVNFTISNLNYDDATTLANIQSSVGLMILARAAPAYALNGVGQPAQTVYSAWVSQSIMEAIGVNYFDLAMLDHAMPTNGSLAVLGTIQRG
jgi:uncharacterized phage protein gp47/JayE